MLVAAFPNIPRGFTYRQAVWDRCEIIRVLRNRVFHYEPVWNDLSLASKHGEVLDALGWISQDMIAPIALSDRFTTVRHTGRLLVEQKVTAHLGIL